jgi:hypothetical protein
LQVLLQSSRGETALLDAAEADLSREVLSGEASLALLAAELDRTEAEILALYKSGLPAALIHQIVRGAREQTALGRMLLDDCMLREAKGKLTPKHLANAQRWIGGIRDYMEKRKAAYATNCRRKLCVVRTQR